MMVSLNDRLVTEQSKVVIVRIKKVKVSLKNSCLNFTPIAILRN